MTARLRRIAAVAAPIALLLAGALLLWPSGAAERAEPSPAAESAAASATPGPARSAAPAAPEPAPAEPAPAARPETPGEARERVRWERRLAARDAELVRQVVAAGCDPKRADVLREVLAEQRAARAETVEAYRSGRIGPDALARQVRAAKRLADEAAAALLNPAERAALDPVGARAAVIRAEAEGNQ